MNRHSSARAARRLGDESALDAQQAWFSQAERDTRTFLMKHGHQLSDPSLVHWVVAQCAEDVWEGGREPGWGALRVGDVWSRLERLRDFFPLPRLVVAYYETLNAFLPWLAARVQIERGACADQLRELERVCLPTLSEARRQLATRARGHG